MGYRVQFLRIDNIQHELLVKRNETFSHVLEIVVNESFRELRWGEFL